MYNVETGNTNDRTIQYFSTTANEKMRPSADQAFYPEFQKYYDYYGDADYGDKWVSAAFDGSATGFSSGRGDADFSKYEADARSRTYACPLCSRSSLGIWVLAEHRSHVLCV